MKRPTLFCTAMVDQSGAPLVMFVKNGLCVFLLDVDAAEAFGESVSTAAGMARTMATKLTGSAKLTRGQAS